MISILSSNSGSSIGGAAEMSARENDDDLDDTKHNTIMRKYSVKNTLYHKTSPVIVT